MTNMTELHSETNVAAVRDRFGFWPAGIFLVALLVRVIHLWQIHTATFFSLLMGDAEVYDAWAQQIAAGDWLGNEVFFQAPLYPYFLGAIYAIFGHNLLVIRACQAIIGALSCMLLADAGRRLFSRAAGVAAGLMLALYAPAIFFDSLIQKSALDLFFLCLLLWLLSIISVKPRWSLWTWTGLVTGCLILTRENALVLVIAILLWLFVNHRPLSKQHLVFAGLFLIGLAAVLLPVAIRNKIVGGQFHLTTSQFGYNFYLGNNEHATGYYMPLRPFRAITKYERTDVIQLAEQATGRKLTSAEVSRFWTSRALDYITSQPGDWFKLMAKKFAIIWKATEMVDVEDLYTYADRSIPLRLTNYICHFGTIAPLALLGACITRQKRYKIWLLYLIFAIYTASVVIFYMVARYRYPLVPLLVLFASAGLVEMPRFFHQKSILKIAGPITATIAVAMFCNWPTPETSKDKMQCITHYNLGVELASQDRLDEAISHYRQALTFESTADIHNNLGNALARQGKVDEAINHLRQSLQILPHPDTYYNLAEAFRVQGKFNEAINHYRQALTFKLDDAYLVYYKMGETFRLQGKLDEAISHYHQALRLKPDYADAQNQLGIILASQGKLNEAINQFRQVLRINPDNAYVHYNLGFTYLIMGDTDSALEQYNMLKSLDQNLANKLFNLINNKPSQNPPE